MKKLTDNKEEVVNIIKASNTKEEAIKKLSELEYAVNEDTLAEFINPKDKSIALSEEDLKKISAGTEWYKQKLWGDKSLVQYLFNVGDEVEVASGFGFGTTVRCRITDKGTGYFSLANGGNAYFDIYYCENVEYTWYFYDGWKTRDMIEKR